MTNLSQRCAVIGLTLVLSFALTQCEPAAETPSATARPTPNTCCTVTPGAGLEAGMGRVVVIYPGDGAPLATRLDVYQGGDALTPIGGGWGNQSIALPAGTYDVTIGGKRVAGIDVQAGQDTRIRVGVLHVYAGEQTRIDLLDPASGEAFTGGYGEKSYGLPIGPVSVAVAGLSETALIEDGATTEF